MNLLSSLSVLGLGLALGLKHALDADHLAAVSTIVSERKSLMGSTLVGAFWGLGHTLALLAAGVAVIVFRFEISTRMEAALELSVAVMLIALGANALWKIVRGDHLHLHTHRHGRRVHVHFHFHDSEPDGEPKADAHTHHGLPLGARSLLVGMVHGFAGSAALMLLVLSTIPSPAVGLAYVAVFGVGSIGGMIFMSALIGLPMRLGVTRFGRAQFAVRAAAGVLSLAIGFLMAYDIGAARTLL